MCFPFSVDQTLGTTANATMLTSMDTTMMADITDDGTGNRELVVKLLRVSMYRVVFLYVSIFIIYQGFLLSIF